MTPEEKQRRTIGGLVPLVRDPDAAREPVSDWGPLGLGRHRPPCPNDRSHPVRRSEWFDAYACPACDVWCEDACPDVTCEFCDGRPAKPSEVRP